MQKSLLAAALLLTVTVARGEGDFWHTSVQGCLIGGGVMGATTALMVYPATVSGAVTVPATTLIVGNTIFGCGLGTIGTMIVYGAGSVSDYLFGDDGSASP
jgi:hypothetical protein